MRYGGDELVAILPRTGLGVARKVFDRLRRAVADTIHQARSGEKLRSTVSIGLASHQDRTQASARALELVRVSPTGGLPHQGQQT